MRTVVLQTRGLLFDLDGVFVDSTESVERHWRMFADTYDIDADDLLTRIHGVPQSITIPQELSHIPEQIDAALARQTQLEEADATSDLELPGGRELVASLPNHGWAVVTSCWRRLAELRAEAAGIQLPEALVTADQVERGKPAPDGYLKGAALIGVDPAHCIVFEDAPSGIEAAIAAGATAIALRTTTPESKLTGAAYIIDDLSKVSITATADGFEVVLSI